MGGRLLVRTELRENVYRIQFSDSGYGMNEATRRQTFQPFFTTKPNGTGLGLTLTRSIVEEVNGSLHCESQLGQGTTFTLYLPPAEQEVGPVVATEQPVCAAGAGETILLLEDNESARDAMQQGLEEQE